MQVFRVSSPTYRELLYAFSLSLKIQQESLNSLQLTMLFNKTLCPIGQEFIWIGKGRKFKHILTMYQ